MYCYVHITSVCISTVFFFCILQGKANKIKQNKIRKNEDCWKYKHNSFFIIIWPIDRIALNQALQCLIFIIILIFKRQTDHEETLDS